MSWLYVPVLEDLNLGYAEPSADVNASYATLNATPSQHGYSKSKCEDNLIAHPFGMTSIQPFSTASHGRRVACDLWPEVRRIIGEVAPGWVFLENVQRKPIARAADELARAGYCGRMARLCASQVGAPHQRSRWWLLAHANNEAQPSLRFNAETSRKSAAAHAGWEELPTGVLGVLDGVPHRMDRFRVLGNAVVSSQAALAFSILIKS